MVNTAVAVHQSQLKVVKLNKKSQGISINTIIIAAIALAVLVVLFMIFTGRFKIFSEGVKGASLNCDRGCKSVGYSSGTVESGPSGTQECSGDKFKMAGKFEDTTEGQICCCSKWLLNPNIYISGSLGIWGMVKRRATAFFYDKKGLEIVKTLIYVLIAIGVILIFGWAIANAADKIFG